MKNNNYPNWLVPLDIAQQLKEIGFDEPTLFHYYEHDFDITIETNSYYDEGEAQGYLHFYISALKEEDFNHYKIQISIPTWEQVFQWFRSKGYHGVIAVRDEDGDNEYSYCIDYLNELSSDFEQDNHLTYEEAREALAKALIRTYKQEQLK